MKNEKIIEYIKQSFDSGKTEEEIKSNLLSVGWVTGQVEEALAFLRDNPKFKKRSLIQKLFFGLISIITNIGFIVFVFGSGLMFFFAQSWIFQFRLTILFAVGVWATLIKNLSFADLLKKNTLLVNRILIVISLLIIVGGICGFWEFTHPEIKFYRANGISIIQQSNDFKPCKNVPFVNYENEKYKTIQIGKQCWMQKNINVGEMIKLDEGVDITDGKIQKYCSGDSESACDDSGGLYNRFEAMKYRLEEGTVGICPNGWHIPTLKEVKEIDLYFECGRQGDRACADRMHQKAQRGGFTQDDLSFFISTMEQPSIKQGTVSWNTPIRLPVKCVMNSNAEILTPLPKLSGLGTAESPYLIGKLEDFAEINKDLKAYYFLTNDIDASVTETWKSGEGFLPVAPYFYGTFDGNNRVISNLHLSNLKYNEVGLFSNSSGTIRNLKLTNVYIFGIVTGGVVGFNNGLIENVSVQGEIDGSNEIGGIAGTNISGTIRYTSADVSISGDIMIGGITGSNANEIRDSYVLINLKKVNGRKGMDEEAGLLVGDNRGKVINSYVATSKPTSKNFYLAGNNEKGNYNSYLFDFYKNNQFSAMGYDDGSNLYLLSKNSFKDKNTYKNWDFTNVWNAPDLNVNNGYPTLKNRLIKEEIKNIVKEVGVKISAEAIVDNWGDTELNLKWDRGESPYVIILRNDKEIPDPKRADIVYYGSKESSIAYSLYGLYSKKNEKICFSIFGVDSDFKLNGVSSSTCFVPDYNVFFKKSDNHLFETALSAKKDSFCDHITDADLRDVCYVNVADKTQSLMPCDKCSSDSKYLCYAMIASMKNDLTICDGIPDIDYKNNCYNEVASSSKDVSICERITIISQRDSCYYNYAAKNEDPSVCNKITKVSDLNDCLSNASRNK